MTDMKPVKTTLPRYRSMYGWTNRLLRVDLSELRRPIRARWLGKRPIGRCDGDELVLPVELAPASVEAIIIQRAK